MASDDIVLQLADQFAKLDSAMQAARRTLQGAAADVDPGLRSATRSAGEGMGFLETAAGKLAGVLTLGAVVRFGADLFAAAGHLQDLTERTHIGVDALQRFGIIAEQSGTNIDAISNAVFQMGKRIAGDDAGAAAAVRELGLNFDEIRRSRPEDAFNTLGKAIAALSDPMQQDAIGARLFGKSVGDLIPVFQHLNDEIKPYNQLTEDQVDAIDRYGDAWVKLKASIVPTVVTMIEDFAHLGEAEQFWRYAAGDIDDVTKSTQKAAEAAARAAPGFGALIPPKLPKDLDDINLKLDLDAINAKKAAEAATRYAEAWENLTVIGQDVRATVDAIEPSLREQVEWYLKGGASVRDLANAYPELTEAQIHAIDTWQKTTEKSQDVVRGLWQEYDQLIDDGSSAFDKQIDAIDRWAEDLEAKMQAAGADTEEFYTTLATVWTAKLKKASDDSVQVWLQDMAKQHDASGDWFDDTMAAMQAWRDLNHSIDGATMSLGGWMDNEVGTISMLDAVGRSVSDTSVKVRTLSGELISVKEAMDRWTMGNSITYDLSTDAGIANYKQLNPSASISWSDAQIEAFIRTGGTLAQLINQGVINPYAGYSTFPTHDYVGPARGGQPYWIGAGAQPELFVPQTDGMMFPHGAAGGGLKVDVHFHGGVIDPATAQHMATQLGAAILGNTGMSLVGV